jgi:glyoxylase-like metal-dependent hydrolase (beta-lactamase superfamily II)
MNPLFLQPPEPGAALEAGGHPLRCLVATHFHPDHLGLVGWLEARTGAPLWTTLGEYARAQLVFHEIAGFSPASTQGLLPKPRPGRGARA